ncbi:hypothetical protein [Curvibacter delicatus]|uniref:hypothetical protein n=1 Tax=Curvibacter delicatus TaxID=80879 RepID=UPI00082F2805|nr:hypothetical protein [Curvibacter delicatus]
MIFEKRAAPSPEVLDTVEPNYADGSELPFAELLLGSVDDSLMAEVTRRPPGPDYDLFARMVARVQVPCSIGGDICAELFLLPILFCPNEKGLDGPDVCSEAAALLRQTLASWFQDSGRNIVFEGIYWLEWLMAWQPDILRQHLGRAVGLSARAAIQFQASSMALPDAAPGLAFVILARTRFNDWPRSAIAEPREDARLRSIASHALHFSRSVRGGGMDHAPVVLSPAPWRIALVEGLCKWLGAVHSRSGIVGWSLEPQAKPRDQVVVRLWLDDAEVSQTRFALRIYQMGMSGLREVLLCLAEYAPCVDQPSD